MRLLSICFSLLLGSLAAPSLAAPTLDALAQGEHRSEKNIARNQFRNPVATLEFLGLTPDMKVVELWPGGGWYTEILAPYLRDSGTYIAAGFNTEPAEDTPRTRYRANAGKRFAAKLAEAPKLYDHTKMVVLDPPAHSVLGPQDSADMVLTFRNLHNWAMAGQMGAVFKAAYDVLTPGGVFGVIEHRGNPGMPASTGYMVTEEVIALAKEVGFKLAAESEINANPKDIKAYPKGVWTLPPSLRLGDERRAEFLAIGESDRMTLKFVKPEI